jgi:chromosome partitioning protein
MRTIAIINQKGGCGKTTTSINLAACLAHLGQKTLLVDMDPQGHCGVGLAVPEEQVERTIYDCLIEEGDGRVLRISDVVWQIASDFDLAPSNLKLAAFEQVFAGRPRREERLAKALESVREKYDYVVIDCPPSVGIITFNALRAADEVVVPVETGYFSLHGLTKMLETLELMRERCENSIRIRVLPNLYDTRTKLAREVLSELRQRYRSMLMSSTVNFNTKLKEAASFGQPITEYDPGSRGYKDFVNLARELMGGASSPVAGAAVGGAMNPSSDWAEAAGSVGQTAGRQQVAAVELSRPAELVQRARQLAQLTNVKFGRTVVPVRAEAAEAMAGGVDAGDREVSAGGQEEYVEPVVAQHQLPTPAETARTRGTTLKLNTDIRSTDEKLDDFYGVKQQGREMVIATTAEQASRVAVAGDFNGWSDSASPMQLRNDRWVIRLPLNPGRYRYRLVVDGRWVTDGRNQFVEVNEFGELNNILEVA